MSRTRRFKKRPSDDFCGFEGCENLKSNPNFCSKHQQRFNRYGDASIVKPRYRSTKKCLVVENGQECERKHCAKDLCQMHYRRFSLYGDPLLKLRSGDKTPARYKVLKRKEHPNARSNGNILEHRLVMSEAIGRPLLDHENVHHINGDRFDNRLENLELWSVSQPSGQRIPDKVEWALELLKLYAPEKLRKDND